MGLRETLNQKKPVGVALAVGMLVVAIGLLAHSLSTSAAPSASEAYYTSDDGQTYFGGSIMEYVPPTDHDGKTVVRAHPYRCEKCGKTFVNHLERYTPEARKVIAAAYANADPAGGTPANVGEIMGAQMSGVEYKKPGDAKWVRITDRTKATNVTAPTCPSGDGGEAVPLNP